MRLFVLSQIAICLSLSLSALAQERPPNFVVVFCDDLGYGDIGPFGADLIATPHLDRMATQGVALTNFYASASVCTPSRGGLVTGRYPARLGLAQRGVAGPGNDIALQPEEVTIAETLKTRKYATAAIGKWHLGNKPEHWPTAQGFDSFYGVPWSNDMTPFQLFRQSEMIEDPVDQTTLTERYTAEAIAFIEAHQDEPFFVYLAHSMPHVPLFVSEKFQGKSKAGLYGDVIETLDWGMGEIFAALERLELDDDTLVIFTSDNGPWWEGSSGDLRDRKGAAWEGGMRVPFIARWPEKLPAGKRSDAIAMNIDLFPTLAELAGADLPAERPLDGKSIWPVLADGAATPHEYLLFFNADQLAGVRTQRWKLVVRTWYRGHNADLGRPNYYHYPGLLFDLEKDPQERYSFTRENPEVAKQMRAWLDAGVREILAREPQTPESASD